MLKVLDRHSDAALLLPLHQNPTVREPLQDLLGSHPRVVLTEPLDYDRLVAAMKGCTLLLTDSGGLQEEAPALGKPVLVLRRTTERRKRWLRLGRPGWWAPTQRVLWRKPRACLDDNAAYEAMSRAVNPFGDGQASNGFSISVDSISASDAGSDRIRGATAGGFAVAGLRDGDTCCSSG